MTVLPSPLSSCEHPPGSLRREDEQGRDLGPCPRCAPAAAAVQAQGPAQPRAVKAFFVRCFEDALAAAIVAGQDFTVDDLYQHHGLPASQATPNRVGALMAHAARSGRIQDVGSRRSAEKSRKGSRVTIWRARPGTDRDRRES